MIPLIKNVPGPLRQRRTSTFLWHASRSGFAECSSLIAQDQIYFSYFTITTLSKFFNFMNGTQQHLIHIRPHELLTVFYLYSECSLKKKCKYNVEIRANNKGYIKTAMFTQISELFRHFSLIKISFSAPRARDYVCDSLTF